MFMFTYRFIVPLMCQVKFDTVNNEQGVNNDKKVMWIPEGIESSKLLGKFTLPRLNHGLASVNAIAIWWQKGDLLT